MSSKATYDAIMTRLQAVAAPHTVVDYDDLDEDHQQDSGTMVVLQETSADEIIASMGDRSNNRFRETAAYLIHIFIQSTDEMDAGRVLAETIRDGMRFQTLPAGGDTVRTLEASPPNPGLPYVGVWRTLEMTLTAERDYFRATA